MVPLQVSCGSQTPVDGRHTAPAAAYLQLEVQHSSLLGSHWELAVNLHVVGTQQVLFPHPLTPPQSHSSPASTIPLPHWLPVIVVISLFATKQEDLTEFRPRAEHMFPMVHAENLLTLGFDAGFMMNCPPASQVEALKGQHCWAATVVPSLQVWLVQS